MEPPNHKQKFFMYTDLVSVECDENIAGLVMWLNSFKGIKTQFSCEGREGIAYVLFSCDYIDSLHIIGLTFNLYFVKTKRKVKFSVNFHNPVNFLRFEIEFNSEWIEDLTKFVQNVKISGWQKTGHILEMEEEKKDD